MALHYNAHHAGSDNKEGEASMSAEEKRKNIIHYYVTITTGVAFGFVNSSALFFLSLTLWGVWWSYPGLVTGVLGMYFGFIRLKIDYQTLRHSLENVSR